MNPYMNQYQNNQVQTASPEQVLIMLYDGAIRFTKQAQLAMAEGKKTERAEKISRAMAIICEFSNTLDREVGGEMAENLDALYHYMIRELTRANLSNDPQPLKTVEGLLSDLRETWMQAIEQVRSEQKAQGEAGQPDGQAERRTVNASF